jgi:hypothetical protein
VSDALGTTAVLRAMNNYAGHRLSPRLGHIVVSRQETARALLTPGEAMQSWIASWQHFCSFIEVTRNLWAKCAKMGRSMNSQSQFCITAVLDEVSDPKRGFGWDHRSAERLNRARQVGIDDTHQRIAQMEAIVADFDRTATELEGWITAEQSRTKIHDPAHFAYSTIAIAMTRRRDALKRSCKTLMRSIDEQKCQLADGSCLNQTETRPADANA